MAATSQADSASKMQIAWPVRGRKNPPRYLTSRSAVLAPRAALARAFWVLERGVCAVGVGDPVAGQVGRVHVSEQRARGVHVGKDEGRVPRAGLCRGLTEASVSVSSSADPSVFGQPVTVTATVTAAAGQPVPAGTVQFAVDGQDLGSPVTLSGGSVTSDPTASLAVGHHAVTATYTPADGSAPSSGTLTPDQNIQQGATTTTLTSSPNPSQPGQTVTYTATVAPASPAAGTPTGTVSLVSGPVGAPAGHVFAHPCGHGQRRSGPDHPRSARPAPIPVSTGKTPSRQTASSPSLNVTFCDQTSSWHKHRPAILHGNPVTSVAFGGCARTGILVSCTHQGLVPQPAGGCVARPASASGRLSGRERAGTAAEDGPGHRARSARCPSG